MIPLADENPTRSKPYVVYVLIALNVLVYLVDKVGATNPFGNLWQFSMVPYSVIHDVRVVPAITQTGQLVYHTAPGVGIHPQWVTVFTSMFMHGSLMHIGGNMLYLWVFGNNIEDVLGKFKFVLFYLACGVLAALAHIFSAPNSPVPTVGASGAIAGVLGAYIVLYPHARVRTLIWLGFFVDYVAIPAIFVLGVWFLIQLTGTLGTGGTLGGGVAYWAHVGGFIAGALLIYLLGGRKLAQRRVQRYRNNDRPYPFRP